MPQYNGNKFYLKTFFVINCFHKIQYGLHEIFIFLRAYGESRVRYGNLSACIVDYKQRSIVLHLTCFHSGIFLIEHLQGIYSKSDRGCGARCECKKANLILVAVSVKSSATERWQYLRNFCLVLT